MKINEYLEMVEQKKRDASIKIWNTPIDTLGNNSLNKINATLSLKLKYFEEYYKIRTALVGDGNAITLYESRLDLTRKESIQHFILYCSPIVNESANIIYLSEKLFQEFCNSEDKNNQTYFEFCMKDFIVEDVQLEYEPYKVLFCKRKVCNGHQINYYKESHVERIMGNKYNHDQFNAIEFDENDYVYSNGIGLHVILRDRI